MKPGRLFFALFWIVACIGSARADWLWFDDSRPAALRIEANGFTLTPLVVAGEALTDATYQNRDRTLPRARSVSFAGTFSLYDSAPSTFAWTLFFLPPDGGTAPAAELTISGTPWDAGEHIAGAFIGAGDPALPATVPGDAAAVVTNPDFTFPFHTQNLSMLVSVARVGEPAALGLLGMGLAGIVAARGRQRRWTDPPP